MLNPSAINQFNIVGTCYNNAKIIYKNKKAYSSFVVYFRVNGKVKYIPIIALDDERELFYHVAKVGNLVAISGCIDSTEYFNKLTGVSSIRTFFIGKEIMLLRKARKKDVSVKKIDELIGLFELE